MLGGLFIVPALLLVAGHRLRRRPARWQSAFWGAIAAHVVAGVLATLAGLFPPEDWRPDDFWRGLLGFWLLLVAPLVGGIAGFLKGDPRSKDRGSAG